MKMVKSLLLASAAGLVATAGAQAADLPVKAKAVEYVKVCSLYGVGFYYIPGTDTCIRIGGHLRSEIGWNSGGSDFQAYGPTNGNTTGGRDRDYFYTRQRVFLQTDTRTQSEWGTVRTFSLIRFEFNILNPIATIAPTPPTNNYGTANLGMDAGYIQWGGLTVGKLLPSFYDLPWSDYASSYTGQSSQGSEDTTGGVFTLGYTYQFGNGVSGTLAVQDMKQIRTRATANLVTAIPAAAGSGGGSLASSAGGEHAPDIVGNILVNQAWGAFQVSAMARDLTYLYNGSNGSFGCIPVAALGPWCSGTQSDTWGYAAQAGLKINLPWGIGGQDAFWIQGGWAHGITNATYNINSASGIGIFNGASGGGGANTVNIGYVADAIYAASGPFPGVTVTPQLTNSWGVSGTLEHNWNDKWKTSITAGYGGINYDATADALLCAKFGVASPTSIAAGVTSTAALSGALLGTSCNFNLRQVAVSSRTLWTPVKDFQIGLEVQWSRWFNQLGAGAVYVTPPGGVLNAAAVPIVPGATGFLLHDEDIFSGYLAFRRYF